MSLAYQAWMTGEKSRDAIAAGCEFARVVSELILFVDAHRKKG